MPVSATAIIVPLWQTNHAKAEVAVAVRGRAVVATSHAAAVVPTAAPNHAVRALTTVSVGDRRCEIAAKLQQL